MFQDFRFLFLCFWIQIYFFISMGVFITMIQGSTIVKSIFRKHFQFLSRWNLLFSVSRFTRRFGSFSFLWICNSSQNGVSKFSRKNKNNKNLAHNSEPLRSYKISPPNPSPFRLWRHTSLRASFAHSHHPQNLTTSSCFVLISMCVCICACLCLLIICSLQFVSSLLAQICMKSHNYTYDGHNLFAQLHSKFTYMRL